MPDIKIFNRRDFVKTTLQGTVAASFASTGLPTIVPSTVFRKNAAGALFTCHRVGIESTEECKSYHTQKIKINFFKL